MLRVDLLIMAGSVVAVAWVIGRRLIGSRITPIKGEVMLLSGIALLFLIYIGDAISLVIPASSMSAGQPSFIGLSIPDWLHWVLSRIALPADVDLA